MSKAAMMVGMLAALARTVGRRAIGRPRRREWSFGFEAFADALKRAELEVHRLPPSEQGDAWARRALAHPILDEVRFEPVDAGGVPGEWLIPRDLTDGAAVVLYLHGGWYSSASARNYRELLARVTVGAGVRALAIDYRLAPAHPFPAAVEDTLAAWRWLVQSGFSPSGMAVAGDSAGGGLTAALLISLRDAGEPLPRCGALLCPWVDLAATGGSLVENARYDWSDPSEVAARVRLYLGDRDPKTPLASPVYAPLHDLPPLLIQVGGAEMLLDQATHFATRARDAGTPVTLSVAPHMIHDWHLFAALVPEARAAIDELAAFLRDQTAR